MVVGLLLPAHQKASKSIQPRMATLNNPATSSVSGHALESIDFFAASPDVADVSTRLEDARPAWVVISLVETEIFGGVGRARNRNAIEGYFPAVGDRWCWLHQRRSRAALHGRRSAVTVCAQYLEHHRIFVGLHSTDIQFAGRRKCQPRSIDRQHGSHSGATRLSRGHRNQGRESFPEPVRQRPRASRRGFVSQKFSAWDIVNKTRLRRS